MYIFEERIFTAVEHSPTHTCLAVLVIPTLVLRCASSRTVPGSIPGGITGFFSDIFLPIVPWPWGRLSP
jgi:hypothetical protein